MNWYNKTNIDWFFVGVTGYSMLFLFWLLEYYLEAKEILPKKPKEDLPIWTLYAI